MARRILLAVACSVVLAGSLTACSSDTQSDAESAVCTSIAGVKTAAAGVRALDATSTVNEVEDATKALDTAIEDLKKNAEDLNQADLVALEAAGDDIAKAAVCSVGQRHPRRGGRLGQDVRDRARRSRDRDGERRPVQLR